MIDIIIVDDHEVVRTGMRTILAKTTDLRITAEAPDVSTALQVIATANCKWKLMLLDISLAGENGIEALPLIRQRCPDMPILMFTGFPELDYAIACFKAGATGYLLKDASLDDLRYAMRTVAAGKRYISPALERRMKERDGASGALHERLTPIEMKILLRLAKGQGLTEIGAELKLSPKTIYTHKEHILEKLELNSVIDLALYVQKHQLDPNARSA